MCVIIRYMQSDFKRCLNRNTGEEEKLLTSVIWSWNFAPWEKANIEFINEHCAKYNKANI